MEARTWRRVRTLPPTRLEPFAFAAQFDQLFKKQGFGLPLKQPRAELGQDRVVKARRIERQGERVFPINAAAHGVGGLAIGETFGELKTSHQGQSPGASAGRPGASAGRRSGGKSAAKSASS